MTEDELMAEVGSLAKASVANQWGGPFGALIAREGRVLATGYNRVLLTGDPTAHAEMEAIRNAVDLLNQNSLTTLGGHLDNTRMSLRMDSCLDRRTLERPPMLSGFEIYSSGEPCPMCLAAIYWARLDACHYSCGLEMTHEIGFDDAFLYEELIKRPDQRSLKMKQIPSSSCEEAYEEWLGLPDRRIY